MSDNERAASDGPMVADPEKAGVTEQTGGSGTGTQGSSNVAGQKGTDPTSGRATSDPAEDERISQ